MTKFALAHLTVYGARPAELVEIAAGAGYDAISPFIGADGGGKLPTTPLKAGDPETVAMAKRMAETGLSIHIGDGFALYDGVPMEELRAGVSLMRDMGARAINVLQFDEDDARGFDRFCQLREWAGQAGLKTLMEFAPVTRIPGLKAALAYRERAGGGNVALLVDLLHLYRSGGQVSDLAEIDPSLIGGVQLCDGPREPGPSGYWHECMYERMIPGTGSMQVRELASMLPDDMIVDLEVPLRSLEERGEGHEARARRVLDASRALF